MKKNQIKVYNIIFPVWVLWLVPITWIVVLPANFVIDLTVIVLTMKWLKVSGIKQKAKVVILKTWLFGFLADFIGTICMGLPGLVEYDIQTEFGRWWYDNVGYAISYDPFKSWASVLWITACVIITSVFIYLFNYKICFKKLAIEISQKKKLALSMAVFTAPYLFYLPTKWFF